MSQSPLPPLPKFELGPYRHYKTGEVYEAIALARHSETLEPMVVYKNLSGDKTWARPHAMFVEMVELDGKKVPRFEKI